jgi:hypothetical protein
MKQPSDEDIQKAYDAEIDDMKRASFFEAYGYEPMEIIEPEEDNNVDQP